jgi:hypothetical protein
MPRPILCLPALCLPLLVLACGNYTGQNGLNAYPDGYIPIPLYEAGPPVMFDGTIPKDAPGSREGSADAPVDVAVETTKEAAADAPSEGAVEASPDAPRDGAGPG